MTAALTIAILLVLSVAVVRIAAVAMRQTGLSENVARFQCLSALTGTGFTTHESEMIVNYPIRRRILVGLMVLGNLGLVSISATFIVTFVETGSDMSAIAVQILAFMIAIGAIMILVINKKLDQFMCDLIGTFLRKTTSLGRRQYQRILQLNNEFSVAEHIITGTQERRIKQLALDAIPLKLLVIRNKNTYHSENINEDIIVYPGDALICYGSDEAHDKLEDLQFHVAKSDAKSI